MLDFVSKVFEVAAQIMFYAAAIMIFKAIFFGVKK